MADRIRVGIVGASRDRGWAVASHIPALAHLDDLELIAVATTRSESAQAAAEAFGVPYGLVGAEALAAHPEVDLVVVAVKAPAHAAAIRAALAAGKHVLSEWPLGVDADEAAALAAEAAGAGVVHAVALQGYHSPSAAVVADLVAAGRLGQVVAVGMVATGDPLGGATIIDDLAWGADASTGNTLLTIMGGHSLSVLDRIVGTPTDVSGLVGVAHDHVIVDGTGASIPNTAPSAIALTGSLPGGAVLSLNVHGGSGPGPDGFQLRITGTEGTLTADPIAPGEYANWARWRIRVRAADGTVTEHTAPGTTLTGPPANIAALYLEVAAAIRDGRQAHPSFATADRIHRVLAALETASRTGTRQPAGA